MNIERYFCLIATDSERGGGIVGLSRANTCTHSSQLIARMIGLYKQLSPYWNWRDYYHRDCLVANTPLPNFRQPSCTVGAHSPFDQTEKLLQQLMRFPIQVMRRRYRR